jgi:hypothetical protein
VAKPRKKKPVRAKPRKKPAPAVHNLAGRRKFSRTLEGKLVGALEHAQDLARSAGFDTRLDTRRPVGKREFDEEAEKTRHGRRSHSGQWSWKSPWTIISEFTLRTPIGYADLYELLQSWDRVSLSRRIDKFRIARIRVVYSDGGVTEEYGLSETFAWSYALARSMQECNPDIDKSLAQRYAESKVIKIIVWLSDEIRGMKVIR